MATINLYQMYNSKIRKFSVMDSTRFREAFVDAVNAAFTEFNSDVFSSAILSQIGSFDDIIDKRLLSFTAITFDASSNTAISGRDFWTAEYVFEKISDTNGFTDTIEGLVISITNGVLSIANADYEGTVDIPDSTSLTIRVVQNEDGNYVEINGTEYSLDYTLGDADSIHNTGTVASHVISATTGFELKQMRFLSDATVLFNFLVNEGTSTTLTDKVAGYDATIVDESWTTVYLEPSSSLDESYKSCLSMALDYHIQDGGEWATEAEPERERKWYGRGVPMARNIYQQSLPYNNPLGI